MAALPTRPRAEQLYVAYCAPEEGLRPEPGFYVRAASVDDQEWISFAANYPPYELPLDLMRHSPGPKQAPRRLALVPGPHGQRALLHTSYHPQVLGNTFTQILVYERLPPAVSLRFWASPDWMDSCPVIQGNRLSSLDGYPRVGPLNDAALTSFLGESNTPSADQDLATVIAPVRLAADPALRRRLVRRVLLGVLLALQSEGQSRGRFYLHAEPGLAALLFYAAARLLPDAIVGRLTFSTYENPREYRQTLAVATFSPGPREPLRPDWYRERGFALDTFTGAVSAELDGPAPPVLEELLALAQDAEWRAIAELTRLAAISGDVTLASLESARSAGHHIRTLLGPAPAPASLLALRKTPQGRHLLDRHQEQLWHMVQTWSLTDGEVRRGFAPWLQQRLEELKANAAQALGAGSEAEWLSRWRLIRSLLGKQEEPIRHSFLELLASADPPETTRPVVLREWMALAPHGETPPEVDRHIRVSQLGECKRWREAGFPESWVLLAVERYLLELGRHEDPRTLLDALDQETRATLFQSLGSWPVPRQQAVLDVVLRREDRHRLVVLNRLLVAGLCLPGQRLDEVVENLKGFSSAALEFWLRESHLTRLLGSLNTHRATSAPVWDRFLNRLDQNLLLGDERQRKLLQRLCEAGGVAGASLPPSTWQQLADWILLLGLVDGTLNPPPLAHDVRAAGERLKIPLPDLIRALGQRKEPARMSPSALLTVLTTIYPPTESLEVARLALQLWLELIARKDTPRRGVLELDFFEHHVPTEIHEDLAKEFAAKGLLTEGALERLVPPVLQPQEPTPSENAIPLEELPEALPEPPPNVEDDIPEVVPVLEPNLPSEPVAWQLATLLTGRMSLRIRRLLGAAEGARGAGNEVTRRLRLTLGNVERAGKMVAEFRDRPHQELEAFLGGMVHELSDLEAEIEDLETRIHTLISAAQGPSAAADPQRVLERVVEEGKANGGYDFLGAAFLSEVKTRVGLSDAIQVVFADALSTFRQARGVPGARPELLGVLTDVARLLIEYLIESHGNAEDTSLRRKRLAGLLKSLREPLALLETGGNAELIREKLDTIGRIVDN